MTVPALSRMSAEFEIQRVLATYARAVDRQDWALLRTAFHPDAHDDHGPYRGDVDGLVDFLRGEFARLESSTHMVGQVWCAHHDVDTVSAETAATAVHRHVRRDGSLVDLTFAVRYLDRFERRGGRWAIARRLVVVDRSRIDPVRGGADLASAFVRGRTDERDPSHGFRGDDAWPIAGRPGTT